MPQASIHVSPRVQEFVGWETTFPFIMRVSAAMPLNPHPLTAVLDITGQGNIRFYAQATIDFSGGQEFYRAGKRRGFVMIRVEGQPVLIPMFDMHPDDVQEVRP